MAVTRIGVRELRQHASRYLAAVKSGETVEVTERGVLVAVLAPPGPGVAERDRLVAFGRLVPAKGSFGLPPRRCAPEAGLSASGALDAMRGERLP